MFVYIAHADADQAAAEDLKAFLKSRGMIAETETGARGFRHLQASDVVIGLWSQAAVFGQFKMMMEKRLFDAWADEQLVLVKLDHGFLPVGLRDLPTIDASFESARALSVWPQVERAAKAARDQALVAAQRGGGGTSSGSQSPRRIPDPGLGAPPPGRAVNRADDGISDRVAPQPKRHVPAAKRKGGAGTVFSLLVAVAIAGASGWALLTNPDGVVRLPPVTAAIGMDVGEIAIPIFWLAAGGLLAAGALIVAMAVSSILGGATKRGAGSRRSSSSPRAASPQKSARPSSGEMAGAVLADQAAAPAPAAAQAVFISYAHADNTAVEPVVAAVKETGREVWIDKGGIQAGDSWAGEIVRGIKSARGVMVMCSPSAFQSDHIKREVYLADRYKKPMLPVFIAEAQPPEDFEYFFAGVQWLELFKLPESDRSAAIGRALATV